MDHFLQIPQVGREWEDMLESYTTLGYLAGRDRAHPPRHARHRDHVPQPRAPREDRRDARRAVGRARDVRPRRGVVRARAPPLRLGLPAARRALRAPRGRARAAAAHVGQGRAALRGPHDHRRGGDLLPAAAAGAHPDPRRRLGRAQARCGSSRATPTPATSSAIPTPCATRSPCCTSTARPRAATPRAVAVTHLAAARVVGVRDERARARAPRPSRSTSGATASSPRPACRRRSSGSADARRADSVRALRRGHRGVRARRLSAPPATRRSAERVTRRAIAGSGIYHSRNAVSSRTRGPPAR